MPCLFTASILMELLFTIIKNDWIRGIIVVAINVITALFVPGPLYWELHEALMALLFIYLGYLVRKYVLSEHMVLKEKIKKSKWFYVELVVATVVWIYCVIQRYYVNMVWSSYPAYPMSVIAAICGTELFLLLMASFPTNEFVKKMGENSLIIYLVHSLEHNLIPWDMINEQISFQLQLPYMGVRVGTLLLRIALILAITVIIVKIKEQVQGNAREK